MTRPSLLVRLGLSSPEIRAWAMYDWANSAFQTTIITAVFPPFFSEYAAAGLSPTHATARFAWAAIFAGSITLFGNSRAAVLSVILFFIAGAVALTRVNVREGEAQAAAASIRAR